MAEQGWAGRTAVAGSRLGRVIGLVPPLACFAAGVAVWFAFRPGNLSVDSILQIEQAMNGQFIDAHPPFISVVLSLVLRFGGGVGHVVLAQCVLGVLGVYGLAREVLRRVVGPGSSVGVRRWEALAVTAALLCPLSPLAVYLATFWKDVWMLIALCWVAVFALRALDPGDGKARAGNVAGVLAAMTVSVLSRHNALALLPVYGLIVALAIARSAGWRVKVAAFCLPAALFFGVDRGVRAGWGVVHWDFTRFLKVVDLTALCAEDPRVEDESPLFRTALVPGFRAKYVPGFTDNNYRQCVDEAKLGALFAPEAWARLDQEYRRAVRRHPLTFAHVRLGAFLFHLEENPNGKFCYGIDPPRLGLAQAAETAPVRAYFFSHLVAVFGGSKAVWLFGKHGVWLAVAAAGVLGLLARGVRRDVRRAALPLLLLTALGYYLTYLVASCGGDFRYMYPADVLVQGVTLAGLVGVAHAGIRRVVRWGRGESSREGDAMGREEVFRVTAAPNLSPTARPHRRVGPVKPGRARIAVVIPCYRVARHIVGVIQSMPAYVWRVVIVDDASPDDGAERVAELNDPRVVLVRHARNQGVGGAMITGYRTCLEIGADIAVKVDGDGQMDPDYLPDLLKPLLKGEADYTKGNRWFDRERLRTMPQVRRLGNFGLSFLTKLASGYWKIFDPCNGYTAIRTAVLREVNFDEIARDYYFETSMLVQLNLLRAVIADVPIPARYGDEESSLRIGRILRRFPLSLARSLARRVWRRYFLYDFAPVSAFLLGGLALSGWGFCYGVYGWVRSAVTGVPATAGQVMLSTLPLLMGFQLLLQALILDISDQPSKARPEDESAADEVPAGVAEPPLSRVA